MKRLLIYTHYHKYNLLGDYVIYQLKKIPLLFERVVFVSNSTLNEDNLRYLKQKQLITDFLQRDNKGFDFAAWRDGLQLVGFDHLSEYDSITLMNDTCFGPLYDMEPVYTRFEISEIDFWGMTNHRAYKNIDTHKKYPEHIQSYFQVFNRQVIQSKEFLGFWQGVKEYTDVQKVIDLYETQLTPLLVKAGYHYEVVFDTTEADISKMLHPDFTYYAPDQILLHHVPFFKVKSFNPQQHGFGKFFYDYIETNTDYPTRLITDHLSCVDRPDWPFLLIQKNLDKTVFAPITQKVAVHLHVFYTALLQDFLDAFKAIHFSYDLFITTNTKEKGSLISAILKENQVKADITVTGNLGRDILPFLSLRDKLKSYDVMGHFHTKKSVEADFFSGDVWRRELMEMLIKPADVILVNFEKEERLGLVIADIPTLFRFFDIVNPREENGKMAPQMQELWKRLDMKHVGLKKEIDFRDFNVFTMSMGTMFWAKREAIQPLFDLKLEKGEVPIEPLPTATILHAIERMLVYVAWGMGYDFCISENLTRFSPFVDYRTLNRLETLVPIVTKEMTQKMLLKDLTSLYFYKIGTIFQELWRIIIHRRDEES